MPPKEKKQPVLVGRRTRTNPIVAEVPMFEPKALAKKREMKGISKLSMKTLKKEKILFDDEEEDISPPVLFKTSTLMAPSFSMKKAEIVNEKTAIPQMLLNISFPTFNQPMAKTPEIPMKKFRTQNTIIENDLNDWEKELLPEIVKNRLLK
jgi:hypothetical protein